MDPNMLRVAILQAGNQHEAADTSDFCSDAKLTTATGAETRDVQRHMAILEAEGLLELAKASGQNYAARLTLEGMLAVRPEPTGTPHRRATSTVPLSNCPGTPW